MSLDTRSHFSKIGTRGLGMIGSAFCRIAVAAIAMQSSIAWAQGLLPPASVSSNGVFFSAGADYRSTQTPLYALGAHSLDVSTFDDAGALTTFKPRVSGAAGQATIGMTAPQGSALAAFGSNVRIALTGGYFSADGTGSGFAAPPIPIWVLLDGTAWFGCDCVSSQLTTELSGWNVGLSAASDIPYANILWTPSVELVLAGTKNRQALLQSSPTETYTASTKLKWDDAGLKFGLGITMPFAPSADAVIGGTLAVLYRRASLTGSDLLDIAGADLTSAIASDARTWSVVPGLQTQINLRSAGNARIAVYGAMDWDTRVPYIVAPGFIGFPFGTGIPAQLGFTTQTTYRIGGSFTYAFNP